MKILIISNKPHTEIGGIEVYSKRLINLFLNNNYEVFEFAPMSETDILKLINRHNYHFILNSFNKNKTKKNKNFFFETFQIFIQTWKKNLFLNKIIKKNKIDVVIQNTYSLPKIKFLKKTKYVWVQHLNWETYFGESFFKWIKKALKLKGNFSFPNIVCYSKNDISFLTDNKLVKKTTNLVAITPSVYSLNENDKIHFIEQKLKNQIAFIGRLNEKQKNISFLNKIIEKAKNNKKEIKIHVYGDGNDKHIIKNNLNIVFHDSFDNFDIKKIFSNIKLLLLPSNYEGFGLVVVEALSHGVPCIIANTYLNASFLIDDSRGKLMNNFDPQAWVDAINEIMNLSDNEYQKLSNNCLQFAKENLSLEEFNKKWLKLVNK